MDKEEYIKKWLAHELSEEEKQAFEQSPDFASMKKLDKHLATFKAPEFNFNEGLKDLKIRLKDKKRSKVVPLSPQRVGMRIAAGFILLLISSYLLIRFIGVKEFSTETAQNISFYLPDSSYVQLNAKSDIAYNSVLWGYNRSIQLNGEAFFKVQKGEKFEVHSKNGKVTVLGTEFNVAQREGYFEVTCYEGTVSVTSQGKTDTLKAGNRYRIINDQILLSRKMLSKKPNWLSNESTFESIPLQMVLNELSRQYPIQLNSKQVDTQVLYTGGFTHKNLEDALKTICQPFDYQYKIRGQVVTIYRAK